MVSGGGRSEAPFGLNMVRWNPLYVGFLLYMFAIVTYRLPIAMPAMVLALLALPFQRPRFRFPPLLGLFTVYLLWTGIGYFQTSYPKPVGDQWIEYGKVWLIALVAVNALRTRAQLRFYMVFVLVCFAMYPARGAIFNYVFYRSSMGGRAIWNHIYGNPNDLAALTLLELAMAAALLTTERGKWIKRGAMVSVVVLTIVILMTQSRGVLLALGVFVLAAFAGQKRKLRALGFLLLFGAIAVAVAPGGIWKRASGLMNVTASSDMRTVDPEGSAEQRWLIWHIATDIVAEHPLTGVGVGAYSSAHGDQFAKGGYPAFGGGNRDTHSTYLNVLAETGYPGLFLFLLILGVVGYGAERTRRAARGISPWGRDVLFYLEIGLVGYLAAGVWGSYARLSHLWIFLALITAVTLNVQQEIAAARRQPVRSRAVPLASVR